MLTIDSVSDKEIQRAVGQVKPFMGNNPQYPRTSSLQWTPRDGQTLIMACDGYAMAQVALPDCGLTKPVWTDINLNEIANDVWNPDYLWAFPHPQDIATTFPVSVKTFLDAIGKQPKGATARLPESFIRLDTFLACRAVTVPWIHLHRAAKGVRTQKMVIKINKRQFGPVLIESMDHNFRASVMPCQM